MELFTFYKDYSEEPCIYAITNKVNGKIYIGKTKCFKIRHYQHKYSFFGKKWKHSSPHLHNSINKYGYTNFDISIIEFCSTENLAERELYWMTYFNTTNSNKGFNLRLESLGKVQTHSSTSIKISNRLKNEWATGIRKNHSLKLKANWNNNENRVTQQSAIMTKALTKYNYELYTLENDFIKKVLYAELKNLSLHGVIQKMHEKKINCVTFKNYIIKKVKIS